MDRKQALARGLDPQSPPLGEISGLAAGPAISQSLRCGRSSCPTFRRCGLSGISQTPWIPRRRNGFWQSTCTSCEMQPGSLRERSTCSMQERSTASKESSRARILPVTRIMPMRPPARAPANRCVSADRQSGTTVRASREARHRPHSRFDRDVTQAPINDVFAVTLPKRRCGAHLFGPAAFSAARSAASGDPAARSA
jgi:hypothetical protein